MALTFSTRRQRGLPTQKDLAKRSAKPVSAAASLGQHGVQTARAAASMDVQRRKSDALEHALRHRIGLPSHTLAQIEAGLARTSIIDPIENPSDPRLIAKFNEDLCLKHRVLPWRSASGRVIVLAASCDHFFKVRDTLIVIFGPVHLVIVTVENLDGALSRM